MAFYSVLRKLGSDNLMILILAPAYIFLIHLLACPWGSMQSGHLRDLNMMMPFSREKLSEGRPSIFHCLITTGLPRTLTRANC